jgi:hypothetical protein
MRVQVLGSVVVHIALGAVLLLVRRDDAPAQPGEPPRAIEIVEVPPPPAPTAVAGSAPGGGAVRVQVAATTPRRHARSRVVADVDPRGAMTFDDPRDGAAGGEGGGIGGGRGNGIGMGLGGSLAVAPPPPPPPPQPPPEHQAPPVSRARAAKLIYPKRSRDTVAGETFIARVTVDDEGYVVGARLVRGFGGPRDDEAASLIFKFRYAPALDDEGHPIRSTLDQNFLVE